MEGISPCLSHHLDVTLALVLNCLQTKNNTNRSSEPQFHNVTNETSYSKIDESNEDNLVQSVVLVIGYGFLCTVALFGNLLVCHVIFRHKRMRTVTNIFIANLAVSDLLLITLNVPFNIAKSLMNEWVFGDAMCHITNMSLITSVYASTFTLTVIALDRQRVLLYPLRPRIMKSGGLIVVAIIWIVSIIMALPFGIYNETKQVNMVLDISLRCTPNFPSELFEQCLTVVTIVIQYILPLSIIGITYGRIVRRIWERTDLGAVTAFQHARRSKHKKKSIKMLMIVVVVFAVCWMPLNLYHILTDLHPDIKTFRYSSTAFFACHWFALSSTCYNPFIYCWLNEAFRAEIRAVFRCFCPGEISIYPRESKSDSVSHSDSMYLQVKQRSTISSKRSCSLSENLNSNFRTSPRVTKGRHTPSRRSTHCSNLME